MAKNKTDKELINETKSNLHIIEKSVLQKKYTIEEIADVLPGIVHINSIDDLKINFVNNFGEEKFDCSLEDIIKQGAGFVEKMFEPGTLKVFSKPLVQMVNKNDDSEVVSFFQKIRLQQDEEAQWLLTTSKLLKGKHEFISVSQILSELESSTKAICGLLDDNLFLRKNIHLFYKLTKREKEIFKLVAEGFTTKQIAELSCISKYTVSTHRRNITKKLNLKTINDWIRFSQAIYL